MVKFPWKNPEFENVCLTCLEETGKTGCLRCPDGGEVVSKSWAESAAEASPAFMEDLKDRMYVGTGSAQFVQFGRKVRVGGMRACGEIPLWPSKIKFRDPGSLEVDAYPAPFTVPAFANVTLLSEVMRPEAVGEGGGVFE